MTTTINVGDMYPDYISLRVSNETQSVSFDYINAWEYDEQYWHDAPVYLGIKYTYDDLLANSFNDIIEDVIERRAKDDEPSATLQNIWNNTSDDNKHALYEQWEHWAIDETLSKIHTLQNQIKAHKHDDNPPAFHATTRDEIKPLVSDKFMDYEQPNPSTLWIIHTSEQYPLHHPSEYTISRYNQTRNGWEETNHITADLTTFDMRDAVWKDIAAHAWPQDTGTTAEEQTSQQWHMSEHGIFQPLDPADPMNLTSQEPTTILNL